MFSLHLGGNNRSAPVIGAVSSCFIRRTPATTRENGDQLTRLITGFEKKEKFIYFGNILRSQTESSGGIFLRTEYAQSVSRIKGSYSGALRLFWGEMVLTWKGIKLG